ncbi:hypothetical protein AA313_de0209869 [Arthrobotrys entomopaga]|nr:hypothetical protein AA313_de0209869 [Arthrobotrys entomopaga]
MAAVKRVAKELAELDAQPINGVSVGASDSDILKWNIVMTGPSDTPYAGGIFTLVLELPPEYPFKAPSLRFTTKIYHPNVSNDDTGAMCLGILRSDTWKPASRIRQVLEHAAALLKQPNIDDAVETGIADQYKNDYEAFVKTAREWTRKNAK